jgi:hypothetical protein
MLWNTTNLIVTFLVQSINLSMLFINTEKIFGNLYTVKGDLVNQITLHIHNDLRTETH